MNRLLLALSLVLVTSSTAEARRGGGAAHEPGFFMRLAGGFGFGNASVDDSSETTFSGLGGQVDLAFGGTITRNLALHVDLFGASIFEPSVEIDGRDQGDAENTTTSLGALGIGLTGYIMPANLYVSGAVGVGVGTIRTRVESGPFRLDIEEDTDPGLAVQVMVGTEWLISKRWGIGLAGQFIFASLDTDGGVGLDVMSVGLLFSATMN
ncbi:MAG: hypothetical protein IT385_21175 [Deltaproteobacteria bacterium]|nr:hypothetical protein [Deltaproteobacteria bacterium]